MDEVWRGIVALYTEKGDRRYGLHEISQRDHALQCAALARGDNASSALVVAALLHDIGHLSHRFGESPAKRGIDDHHERLGAKQLTKHFGAAVSEPVRLHVPAKRYLCAVEPDYFGKLSPDSVRSLALQGGPMSAAEITAFEAEAWWRDAVALRHWDETAKVPGLPVPELESYSSEAAVVFQPRPAMIQ